MLVETWVIFLRQMRQLIRNPVWVFFGLTQPVLYLVLFGPLLKNVSGGGLGGDASWKVLSNVVTIGTQALVLTFVAIPFGLRPSWAGALLSILVVSLLAVGMAAASYTMGLILKDEDSFAPFVQGVTLPLLLLSGVLLPMALAPSWLRHLSEINPLTYVVDGTRALFRGDTGNADVLWAILVTIGVSVLLAAWGTRQFQKNSA
jgi:ABC-2 type transport system permease protein